MLRSITLILYLIFCGSVVSAQSNENDLLALREKFNAIKSRSFEHEQKVAELLNRPKIQQVRIELPQLPKRPNIPEIEIPLNSTPIPPVPDYSEIPKSSLDEKGPSIESEKPFIDDLVSDPGSPSFKPLDLNNSASKDPDLVDAYGDLYGVEIPEKHLGYYAGSFFGFVFPDDGSVNAGSTNLDFESDEGIALGFQYGRDFGGVCAEAEYSYFNFDGSDGFEISAHDFIARLLFEFEIGERAEVRSGLGMGVGFVNIDQIADYSGVGFCYDLNLGVGYRLNSDWSLNLDYRYFLTAAGDDYDRIKSHMLILCANYDL